MLCNRVQTGRNSTSEPSLSPSGYAFRSGSYSVSEATNLIAYSYLRFHFDNDLVVVSWVTCFSLDVLAAAAALTTSPAAPQPAQPPIEEVPLPPLTFSFHCRGS